MTSPCPCITPIPSTYPTVAKRPLFLHHPMIQSVHCYRNPTLWSPFTLHISDGNYSRIHGKLDLKLIRATFLLLTSFDYHLELWQCYLHFKLVTPNSGDNNLNFAQNSMKCSTNKCCSTLEHFSRSFKLTGYWPCGPKRRILTQTSRI